MSVIDRDLGYKKIMKDFRKLDGKSVVAGVLHNAGKEPNGAKLVDVATWNEYGTSRIPSRPFVRLAFEGNRGKLKQLSDNVAADIIARRGYSTGLNNLGGQMVDDIKNVIGDKSKLAPNAPATIRKKGHDKPLIDKGKLKAGIDSRID